MRSFSRSKCVSEKASTFAEYALIAAVMCLGTVVALGFCRDSIVSVFTRLKEVLNP